MGSTAGYAYVGEMCSVKSTAVVQFYPKTVTEEKVGKIFAHEMGHSLGASHDEATCLLGEAKDTFLMTRYISQQFTMQSCL